MFQGLSNLEGLALKSCVVNSLADKQDMRQAQSRAA